MENRINKLKWGKLIAISIGISAIALILSSSSLSLIPYPKTNNGSAYAIETENNSSNRNSNSNSNRTMGNVTADTIKKTSSSTSKSSFDSKLVTFASNIEKIKGHIEQAILNKKIGNDSLAEAHTLHPIAEIFSDITIQLADTNSDLNQTLSSSLNKLFRTVRNSTAEQFATEANHTNKVLDRTINEVVPSSNRNNSTFNLSVVADLLNTAKGEYGEAIENGKLSLIVEYQDAKGFISRAESVFNQTSSRIETQMVPKVQKINTMFSDLNKAVDNKSDTTTIYALINNTIREIAQTIGLTENQLLVSQGEAAATPATEESKKKSLQTVANVRILLNQTLEVYKAQNYVEAENLATKAYLENYENIEQDIAKFDQPLEKTIEVMLREDLRHAIQQKQPVEKIAQIIGNINNNLVKAENLLSTSKPELGLGSMNITDAQLTAATMTPANQTLSTNSSLKMTNHTNTNTNTNTNTSASSTGYKKKVSITDEESDKPFNPSPLSVKAGDTVIWRNDDVEIHTVTSSGNSSSTFAMTNKNRELDSGPLNPRQTFEHTFEKPGNYNYFCMIHPSMTGEVVVDK
jgi:plastocyanin